MPGLNKNLDLDENIAPEEMENVSATEEIVKVGGETVSLRQFSIEISDNDRETCRPFLEQSNFKFPVSGDDVITKDEKPKNKRALSGKAKESPSKKRKTTEETPSKEEDVEIWANLEEIEKSSSKYPVYLCRDGKLVKFNHVEGTNYRVSHDQEDVEFESEDKLKYISVKLDSNPLKNKSSEIVGFKIKSPTKRELSKAKSEFQAHSKSQKSEKKEPDVTEKDGEEIVGEDDVHLSLSDDEEDKGTGEESKDEAGLEALMASAGMDSKEAKSTMELVLTNFIEAAYERALTSEPSELDNKSFEAAEECCSPKLEWLLEHKLKSADVKNALSRYLKLEFEEKVSADNTACQNECGTFSKKVNVVTLSDPYEVDSATLGIKRYRATPDNKKMMLHYHMFEVCPKCGGHMTLFHFLEHLRWLVVRLFEHKLAYIKLRDPENHTDWKENIMKENEVKELKKRLRKSFAEATKASGASA